MFFFFFNSNIYDLFNSFNATVDSASFCKKKLEISFLLDLKIIMPLKKSVLLQSLSTEPLWFGLISLFSGISIFVDYLMPKLSL